MQNPTKITGIPAATTFEQIARNDGQDRDTLDGGHARVRRSAIVVLAVTLQRLMDEPNRDWSYEEELVLDALRRSTSTLSDATPEQLGEYLAGLTNDQIRGVVSNVKGIFHELLVAKAENSDGDGVTAVLPEATNQPGYDIEFIVDGEAAELVQLKAVASAEHIYEHLARYPEIGVMATEEVAAMIPGVAGSGYRNEDLEAFVKEAFEGTANDSLTEELLEAASTSLFVQAAFAASSAIRSGNVDANSLKAALGDVGIGLTTALVLDILLSGGA